MVKKVFIVLTKSKNVSPLLIQTENERLIAIFSILQNEIIEKNGTPNIIITDPPRDGMHKQVVEQILK